MATSAQSSRLFTGLLHTSGYVTDWSEQYQADMLEVTTIADAAKAFTIGQNTSTFTFNGHLDADATANGQHDVMSAWKSTTPQPVTFLPNGLTITSQCMMLSGLETQYQVQAAVAGTVDFSVGVQAANETDFGVVIATHAAITADGNGTSVDNSAATANGGVAHLHVTAFSGLTNNIITIEHSTDNAAWATLATFATYTAVGYERLVVAAGTTVNRYLRVVDNVTGTGSTTRIVTFARR